jgi:hypothetical protein
VNGRSELALVLLTVGLAGCGTQTDLPARSPADAQVDARVDGGSVESVEADPRSELEQLENRLLGASRVEFEFAIDSEGSLISHFTGRVRWVRDGEFTLTAEGEFVGQPQQLELRGDANTLTTIVAGSERWSGARPPELVVALVRGLSHMGLLHNLAVLTGGMPPDRSEGGAREWLDADDLELGPPETRTGVEVRPLEFVLVVAEQPVGRATLWLDTNGRPVERRQAVEFPEGEMRVVERYSNFVIEP